MGSITRNSSPFGEWRHGWECRPSREWRTSWEWRLGWRVAPQLNSETDTSQTGDGNHGLADIRNHLRATGADPHHFRGAQAGGWGMGSPAAKRQHHQARPDRTSQQSGPRLIAPPASRPAADLNRQSAVSVRSVRTKRKAGAAFGSTPAGAGVGSVVDLRQVLVIEVGVDLGGADVGVSKELLHGPQITARFE